MRYIEWNEEIVNKTVEHYYPVFLERYGSKSKAYNYTLGLIAENLVKYHYGVEIEYTNTPDPGYDFIVKNNITQDNIYVDVKSRATKIDLCDEHNIELMTKNTWRSDLIHFSFMINTKIKKVNPDIYVLTVINPDLKQIVILGTITRDDVLTTKLYKKGQNVKILGTVSSNIDNDMYIIDSFKDRHLIEWVEEERHVD